MIRNRVQSAVLTGKAHSFQYVPTSCRGHRHQVWFVSQADKSVCELALIHVSCPVSRQIYACAPGVFVWLLAVTDCH